MPDLHLADIITYNDPTLEIAQYEINLEIFSTLSRRLISLVSLASEDVRDWRASERKDYTQG